MSASIEWAGSGEISPEARDLLFGSEQWWAHLRAAVAEGMCPRCHGRLDPLPEHEARVAGFCPDCDRTYFVGGPDTEWAEAGESLGRTLKAGGPRD